MESVWGTCESTPTRESLFRSALIEVLKGPLAAAEGLVLDIRGGWGGAQAQYLQYFQSLPTLTLLPRQEPGVTLSSSWNRPVALLINERSKSGKEVFAYGFKKQKLGPVWGSPTGGAVTAGQLFLLSGGCALYVAVADIQVDGDRLEGVGVAPDETMVEPILPSGQPSVKARALNRLSERMRETP